MGQRGREAFLAAYQRSHCCARWSSALGDLLAAHTRAKPATTSPLPRVNLPQAARPA
jgi:hypothetical protein